MQGHIVAKQTTIYVANTKIDSEDVSPGRGIPASSRGTSRLGNWYKDVQNETNNAIRVAKQKYFKSIIWRNKGDPRKALRTRPQPTTSVPVIGKSPGNEVGGITYVKMPTSALCTCISFSLVLCFFKTLCTLNSNFTFECPTNAILQRVSKTVADQRGGSVPTLFFDQQYKSVYRCAYARTHNENMQIKWRAAWLSLGLFFRSKISVLGFPTRVPC